MLVNQQQLICETCIKIACTSTAVDEKDEGGRCAPGTYVIARLVDTCTTCGQDDLYVSPSVLRELGTHPESSSTSMDSVKPPYNSFIVEWSSVKCPPNGSQRLVQQIQQQKSSDRHYRKYSAHLQKRSNADALNAFLHNSPGACTNLYAVLNGDQCSTIAKKNGISLSSLQTLNPTINCSTLGPGDILCLPPVSSPKSTATSTKKTSSTTTRTTTSSSKKPTTSTTTTMKASTATKSSTTTVKSLPVKTTISTVPPPSHTTTTTSTTKTTTISTVPPPSSTTKTTISTVPPPPPSSTTTTTVAQPPPPPSSTTTTTVPPPPPPPSSTTTSTSSTVSPLSSSTTTTVTTTSAAPNPSLTADQQGGLDTHNAARAAVNVSPLVWDFSLER